MTNAKQTDSVVKVTRADSSSPIVLVCEHASPFIPTELEDLGLAEDAKLSHVAWDPGAKAVASHMSDQLDATFVESTISRLVYDCNRPTDAPDAMPSQSENWRVPGNSNLSEAERVKRAARFYEPFKDALEQQITAKDRPVILTIHSFTPVYKGVRRDVEIGILHDTDTRLADAYLATASTHTTANVQRNAPYGPQHGVTHTLKQHAIPYGHHNVMIEIRNDLIATAHTQREMADLLVTWTKDALTRTATRPEQTSCKA